MALRAAPSNWFVVLRSWWQGSQLKAGFHQRLFGEITNFSVPGRTDSTCSVWADPSGGFIKTMAFQLSQSTTKHGTNLYTSRTPRLSSASAHAHMPLSHTYCASLHKQGLGKFLPRVIKLGWLYKTGISLKFKKNTTGCFIGRSVAKRVTLVGGRDVRMAALFAIVVPSKMQSMHTVLQPHPPPPELHTKATD